MAKTKEAVSLNDIRLGLKTHIQFGGAASELKTDNLESIHLGNYALNALVSGSVFNGIPNNRNICLAGESGVGKTYIALNICREAQLMGYHIMYFDSEGAIDPDLIKSFGCDPDKFDIQPVLDISEFRSAVTMMCDQLLSAKKEGRSIPKMVVVLDSLGMLASDKEISDSIEGKQAADFTRAKLIRSMFRILTGRLAVLGIPFIYTNHVYSSIGMFPSVNLSGGKGQEYSPSVTLNFTKAKLKEDADDDKVQTGIILTANTLKNRFAKVGSTKVHIDFKKGMNPYIGLEEWIQPGKGWDNCGIERGNIINESAYNKLDASKKAEAKEFKSPSGEILYFSPKSTAHKFAVKHLADTVSVLELFSSKVFTREVLELIDKNCASKKYRYGTNVTEDMMDLISRDYDSDDSDNELDDELTGSDD